VDGASGIGPDSTARCKDERQELEPVRSGTRRMSSLQPRAEGKHEGIQTVSQTGRDGDRV